MLGQLRSTLESEGPRDARAEGAAERIRIAGNYRWVGIYELDDNEIAAIAWSGRGSPARLRFPVEQGLCGAAVASRSPVAVGDVSKDPRYLTTFGSTQSEIVVPIADPATGAVLGLLDVESERRNAFGDKDRSFLTECAAALACLWR